MIDKLRKHQFKFLNYLFEDMYPVKSKFYPDSTFFKKDNKVTLELEKSGTLWVLYSVWTDIADMFSLDYNETQQLIKAWVEQQIKSDKVAPTRASGMYGFRTAMVEEQLKSEDVTPLDAGSNYLPFMEKQIKLGEVTPLLTILNYEEMIEEQLKPAEITPLQGCVSPFSMDGEELTPQRINYVIIGEIEEELEPVEITPDIKGHSGSYWAESLLKSEEIKPKYSVAPLYSWRKLDSVEITPEESIPLQSWRNLENTILENTEKKLEEVLKSVKYAEIKPTSNKFVEFRDAERRLNSEEIKPRQVVNGSFDWVQDQIKLEEQTKQI